MFIKMFEGLEGICRLTMINRKRGLTSLESVFFSANCRGNRGERRMSEIRVSLIVHFDEVAFTFCE